MKLRILLAIVLVGPAWAQTRRIVAPVNEARRVVISGAHPLARPQYNLGPVDGSRRISNLILLLKRSPAQQADVDHLLSNQRDPFGAQFHKWLTPEVFADRFGLHPDDLSVARAWLTSHGLTIDHEARGRNWIGFSGTAAQVEEALGTTLHRYRVNGVEHFANATPVSVPEALAPVAGAFLGLSDFHPKPRRTGTNGEHSIAPDDLAVIYDITSLYNPGTDGTGQKIAIVGQSELEANFSDIRKFRSIFNLPPNDPQLMLYGPDPGLPDPGDLGEADADIEWSGAIARKATLIYVYSGDSDASLIYAVDQNVAPIITSSYGICEAQATSFAFLMQAMFQQANAQGITVIAAAGDAAAADCDDFSYEPVATEGLAVDYPSSIPEVTAVGGTEFNEGSAAVWSSTNTANGASALSYIPEKVWNDTGAAGAILGGAGGASALFAKPAWQTGPGVPNDGARDTPDVVMPASNYHDSYYECSGGLCGTGNGGTSLAAPVFAGIISLLNQSLVSRGVLSQPGLGNINPELYRLAQSSPTAFHDITVGNNIVPCAIGTPSCTTGSIGYKAVVGYDQASGLGSLDVANLVNTWGTSAKSLTTVSENSSAISMSDSVALSITVSGTSGSTAPTGTVFVNQKGAPNPFDNQPGEILLGTAKLSPSGSQSTATVTIFPGQLTPGADVISVTYAGDQDFNGSSAAIPITVSVPTGHSAVVLSAYASSGEFAYPPAVPNGSIGSTQATSTVEIQLSEAAGVPTMLTKLVISGLANGASVDESSQIAAAFGTNVLPANGTLLGSFTVNVPAALGTITITTAGQDANGFQWSTQFPLPLVTAPNQVVTTNYGGPLVNAASYQEVYAPGMIMGIFGAGLATSPKAASAQTLPLPDTLAGSSATINGVAAPYYYASQDFANVQIPYETASGTAVLKITGELGQSWYYSFTVQPTGPGIFTNANNRLVPVASAKQGAASFFYITGDGALTPALATGATPPSTTPLDQLPKPAAKVIVTVGGVQAVIQFIGVVPGLVGATQINFVVPSNAPTGLQPVVVTVGGVPSQTAYMTVNPG